MIMTSKINDLTSFPSQEIETNTESPDKQEKLVLRLSKLAYRHKILECKRVTKVTKGAKRYRFRAIIVVGDGKEKVGIGISRSPQKPASIERAVLNGKKNLFAVPLTKNFSIPCMIYASYGACKLLLKPAALGTGVIASGVVRAILELSGIQNVVAKQFGTRSVLNNAKVTMLALSLLQEKVILGKAQSYRQSRVYQRKMKYNENAEFFS